MRERRCQGSGFGLALVLTSLMSLAVGVASVTGPARAASTGGGATSGVVWANVQFGTPPSPGGSSTGSCTWRPATTYDTGIGYTTDITRTVLGVLQRLYERSCNGVTTLVWVSQPTPGQLGQAARDVVIGRLPAPLPRTAPPASRVIVHSSLWFWTDPSVWREVSVTAWVPTPDGGVLWSRTTARPVRLRFEPAAVGSVGVSCAGPGRVWTLADGDVTPSPCSVTFVHDSSLAPGGRFPATLGIDWSISWTSSTGRGGALPGHRTVADVPMTVSEIQALVTDSSR